MNDPQHTNLTVQQWIERLRQAVATPTVPPVGVRTRGTLRTRGAESATGKSLEDIFAQLRQESPEVRREVISGLGDQGDALAVQLLGRLAQWEPEWRLRLMIVETLSRSQVSQGIEVLMDLAQHDFNEDVRAGAIRQLGKQALTAWPLLGSQTRATPRVRGAVRTRGVTTSRSAGLSPPAEEILSLLDRLRFRDPSQAVREAADDTLGQLDK